MKKGARIINDISALRFDSRMAEVVVEHDVDVVLMYSYFGKNFPHASEEDKDYEAIVEG